MNAIIPRFAITTRLATADDLPFIDRLQKMHGDRVGWMPTQQLQGKIKLGHVLIAESDEASKRRSDEGEDGSLRRSVGLPVGYCIGNDQYFKRDDVGIIYQMNVVPDRQRGLVGATLVKAMFDRAAYGCRLFCCWCAQDIEANHFWESLGFVPLAFRAGSRGKKRVHIFWQRRVRAGDETTPYWFPSQTTAGSIREDRLVLPIPPGTHWSDAKPVVLPGMSADEPRQLPSPRAKRPKGPPSIRPSLISSGGLRFTTAEQAPVAPPKRAPKPKVKNDPKYVAAARELRDRWLEKVNDDPSLLAASGKYEVSRLPAPQSQQRLELPLQAA